VLLAGVPTLRTTFDGAETVTLVEDDPVIGVVFGRDFVARGIPNPLPGRRFATLRANARAEGGWDVLLAETEEFPGDARPDTAIAIWHAVYDGVDWTEPVELPFPPNVTLFADLPSSLLSRADTLYWAASFRDPSRTGGIALYTRSDGAWRLELIPTFHARVELASTERLGQVMVVVQPDTTQMSDGGSLFLWVRDPEWRRYARIVHGTAEGTVHAPALVDTDEGLLFSWQHFGDEGLELRVTRSPDGHNRGPITSVGHTQLGWPSRAIRLPEPSTVAWLTQLSKAGEARRAIRLVAPGHDATASYGELEYPFSDYVVAAVSEPSFGLLLNGLMYRPGKFIATMLVQAHTVCREPG
jgi:hypothetical protein